MAGVKRCAQGMKKMVWLESKQRSERSFKVDGEMNVAQAVVWG